MRLFVVNGLPTVRERLAALQDELNCTTDATIYVGVLDMVVQHLQQLALEVEYERDSLVMQLTHAE